MILYFRCIKGGVGIKDTVYTLKLKVYFEMDFFVIVW